MTKEQLNRTMVIQDRSRVTPDQYKRFLQDAYRRMNDCGNYFGSDEDINSLELAHLIPEVSETVLAIYVGINDAVCNKGLVTPLLPQHGHNNVFVFDSQVHAGQNDVPAGTIDVKVVLFLSWLRSMTSLVLSRN